tara:strand:+ start:1020 stop:1787 length:768 start_codon:yes stop_codon:yes gene_type:complete
MASRLFRYELFNIKHHNSFLNSKFEESTGLRINKFRTSNKKTDLQFIKNIIQIHDINYTILSQIIIYCNNKQHKSKFKDFHTFIRMMRVADSSFNNNLGLKSKLEVFDFSLSKILSKNLKRRQRLFRKNRRKILYFLQSKTSDNQTLDHSELTLLRETYKKIQDEHIDNTKKIYDKTYELITSFSTLHVNSNIQLPIRQFKNAIFYYAICLNFYNLNKIYEYINEYINVLDDINKNQKIEDDMHSNIEYKRRVKI